MVWAKSYDRRWFGKATAVPATASLFVEKELCGYEPIRDWMYRNSSPFP
jgi:hypothetical protein